MIRTKPMPFQERGVRKIKRFGLRALVGDSMGLGKSLQALICLHDAPQLRPVIIICPATVKWHWQRECLIHLGMRSEVLCGTKPPKRKPILDSVQIYIINYDILYAWLPYLLRLKPKLAIVDEAQYICSRRSRRTKKVRALCAEIPHIIATSGTPLVNRPAELWPVLNLLRPDLYPDFWSFAQRYCKPRRRPWGWEFKGASNIPELHRNLREQLMIRRTKEQVLKELPAKQRSVLALDVTSRREYNKAVNSFQTWMAENWGSAKARQANKAKRLVQIGYLLRLAGRLKLQAAFEWIDNFLAESDEKLIVFAVHRAVVDALMERYGKLAVMVNGSVTGERRQRAIDQFNKDQRRRLFVGNLHAAGVGWSCTSASTVAFVELGWRPGDMQQAEDRIHGIGRGTGRGAAIYYLVARDTIEMWLCELLQKKSEILSGVLDGKSGSDFNIHDELTKKLLKRNPK